MEHLHEFDMDHPNYDLKNLEFLGEGAYGKVFRGRLTSTGEFIAIKQINMQKIKDQGLVSKLKEEIHIMKQLKSENIVRLIDYCIGQKYTYMILQLCDSDLRKAMQKRTSKYSEEQCINIFGEVIKGFKVMIENSCIHRDVKPENVLIKNQVYKLADFGFACKADMYCQEKLEEFCGTPIYMAPQLLRYEPYTAKCDIWSLGLMLYELIYGYTPWPMKCPEKYLQCIKKRPLYFQFGVKIGKETKDFLKKALVEDEQKRMSWQQLFKHPLVADKLSGDAIQWRNVAPKIRRLLSQIQKQTDRKFIDQISIFRKYEKFNLIDFQNFQELMRELNPSITTNEINFLFEFCDVNHDNQIDMHEFEELFCTVDYRSDPETEKEINEIVGIIIARNIQVEDLFKQCDKNHTEALDSNQFRTFIKTIAPKYSEYLISKLYKKFDKDHNGLISKAEFLQIFAKGLVNQNSYNGISNQRARRNLLSLKYHLTGLNMSLQDVMKMGDLNLDHHIDRFEFSKLLQRIKFKISEKEVDQIFKLIDKNNSLKISYLELEIFMK